MNLRDPVSSTFSFAVIILLLAVACRGGDSAAIKDKRKALEGALMETGELRAVNSKIVTVPRFKWHYGNQGRAKLIWLAEEGEHVKKGAIVARLDTSGILRVRGQKQADLDIARADLEKTKVEQSSKIRELMADFQQAEAALKRARIDTQRVQYESEASKEISRHKLKIAEIELDKVRTKIELTEKIHQEEMLIQHAKIKQIVAEIENAERAIERFALRAPADGMVEHRRHRRTREKVRVGQEFRQSQPILGLPDLSQMKVQTTVNEVDIGKVAVGQKVLVRLDAYPKVGFEGKVSSISITPHEKEEKSRIKVFDVEVLLKEADPILKPGMTVSCEIFTGST